VLTAYAVSQLILLLAGGVVADRIPRLLAPLGSDAVRFAAEATLAAFLLGGRPKLLVVLVLVFVQGAASALFMPASADLVLALVEDVRLQAVNPLLQTASSAATIIGPAIAGVLVATDGPGWEIAAHAACYGASVATLAMLRMARLEKGERWRSLADLRERWDEFRSRGWYLKSVVGAAVFNVRFAVYVVLGPVASIRFYSGAKSWAIIATAAGVGSVLGGLLSTRIRSQHPLRAGLLAVRAT
jgi:MFS family permease